jgi:DHA1 family multidrug resistance protein-like MFS transporter
MVTMGMGLVTPILPQYARTFGVTVTMVGLLITTFGVARIIIDMPTGRLADRLGRRPVLIAGPLILALAAIGAGLSQDFWQLLVFRFIQGLGSALYTTAAMIMIADVATPDNRGHLMSLYQGSMLIGNSLGPAVGGFIAQYYGIRVPFFMLAFFTTAAGVWGYFRLVETKPLEAVSETSGQHGSRHASGADGRSMFRDLNFLLISLVTFAIFFTRNGSRNQTFPLLAAERIGLEPGAIGTALTVSVFLNLVSLLTIGRLSDRFGRKAIILPGCILVALSLFMLSYTDTWVMLLVNSAIWGIGSGIAGPAPAAYVADIAGGKRASVMAIYRTVGDAGFVVGPVLLGWLSDIKGYDFSLMVNGIIILAAVILFQLFAKEIRKDHSPPPKSR